MKVGLSEAKPNQDRRFSETGGGFAWILALLIAPKALFTYN